jgi:hypothetical protein
LVDSAKQLEGTQAHHIPRAFRARYRRDYQTAIAEWQATGPGPRGPESRLGTSVMPFSRDAVEAFTVAHQLATIYVLTGNHPAAIAELRQLLSIPSYTTVWRLRLDPIFDPLRRDPAFQALLK